MPHKAILEKTAALSERIRFAKRGAILELEAFCVSGFIIVGLKGSLSIPVAADVALLVLFPPVGLLQVMAPDGFDNGFTAAIGFFSLIVLNAGLYGGVAYLIWPLLDRSHRRVGDAS